MIKCKTIEQFTLEEYSKITNIKRKSVEQYGTLFKGDIFECDEEMAYYLTGKNDKGKKVVKIIEINPEESKK